MMRLRNPRGGKVNFSQGAEVDISLSTAAITSEILSRNVDSLVVLIRDQGSLTITQGDGSGLAKNHYA